MSPVRGSRFSLRTRFVSGPTTTVTTSTSTSTSTGGFCSVADPRDAAGFALVPVRVIVVAVVIPPQRRSASPVVVMVMMTADKRICISSEKMSAAASFWVVWIEMSSQSLQTRTRKWTPRGKICVPLREENGSSGEPKRPLFCKSLSLPLSISHSLSLPSNQQYEYVCVYLPIAGWLASFVRDGRKKSVYLLCLAFWRQFKQCTVYTTCTVVTQHTTFYRQSLLSPLLLFRFYTQYPICNPKYILAEK